MKWILKAWFDDGSGEIDTDYIEANGPLLYVKGISVRKFPDATMWAVYKGERMMASKRAGDTGWTNHV